MEQVKKTPEQNPALGPGDLARVQGQACMLSWSGGKDSCLAAYRAVRAGARIEALVNMEVEDGGRSRSHGLRTEVIQAQARAIGLPLESRPTSWEEYETHFVRVLSGLRERGAACGVFGDIDLQDHLDWEISVCRKAGLLPVLPLWLEKRMGLVEEFLDAGFKAVIVAVRAESLAPEYLGRRLTRELAREFEAMGVDACGENGEFHTVVVDGPLFSEPLELVPGERVHKDGYWFMDLSVRE